MNARKVALLPLLLSSLALAQEAKAPPKKTEITWWGHAAFIVRTPGGATIAIDPWLTNPKAPANAERPTALDAILVTHGHSDHVGDAVALANQTGAQVIGAFELVSALGVKNGAGANIGGSLRVKDVTISLVEAVHSSSYSTDQKPAVYTGSPMGYVLNVDNGPTLYHAGDTHHFASMALIAELHQPQVALLPIGGHFTMDPDGAAIAARLLKVKTVVPMHFGTFPMLKGTAAELTAALKRRKVSAKVVELQPGQTQAF